MKLVVGLGNPGAEYKNTRHNVGFSVLDLLARSWAIDLGRQKFRSIYGGGLYGTEKVLLLKPQTYMNRSGESVVEAAQFYKVALDDILIVLDDMALAMGQMRLRRQGSSGGHKGLQDVMNKLSSMEVNRLRIGIGEPPYGDAVDHVLSVFSSQEQDDLEPVLRRAVSAVECWIDEGMEAAMNRFNMQEMD